MLQRIALLAALGAALVGCYDMRGSPFLTPDSGTDTDDGGTDGGADTDCGELGWVVGSEGSGEEVPLGLTALANGQLIVTGRCTGMYVVDLGLPDLYTYNCGTASWPFLISYAPDGAAQWLALIDGAWGVDESHEFTAATAVSGETFTLTGLFSSSLIFDPWFGNYELLSAGGQDILIAEYDASGHVVWATRAGGTDDDVGRAVASVPTGEATCAVTGSFAGDAVFGEGEGNETWLAAGPADESMFVAVFDDHGDLVWARQVNGLSSGQAVGTLEDGSILVTGWFEGSATFGDGEDNETNLSAEGDRDLFLARYLPDGELDWAVNEGGTGEVDPTAIAVLQGDSGLVVGGSFDGTAFGDGATSLTSAGATDAFLAFFGVNGDLFWTRRAGGGYSDVAADLVRLVDGRIAMTGSFQTEAVFGPGEDAEITLTTDIGSNAFVAIYESGGDLVCARQEGGTGLNDQGTAIAQPAQGSVVIAGTFDGEPVFGEGEENETSFDQIPFDDLNLYLWRVSID
jgi:hypothetical protein